MMSTKHPELFAALAAPFESHETKVRSQAGRQLHYITARTAMNRLDNVLGPESWWDRYSSGGENSVLCELTIRLPDGSTLTKCDAGGFAGMPDQGDDDKSGYSDSFKRACVKFGVARYLYRDGVPEFAAEGQDETPDATAATPAPAPQRQPSPPASNGHGIPADARPPRSGAALFAWTKDQEKASGFGLLKYLNGWSKVQEFPFRMTEWNPEQVALAHAEALRKLASLH